MRTIFAKWWILEILFCGDEFIFTTLINGFNVEVMIGDSNAFLLCFTAGVPNLACVETVDDEKVLFFSSQFVLVVEVVCFHVYEYTDKELNPE